MTMRVLFAVMAMLAVSAAARAEERIADFDVAVDVEQDGDILVTEEVVVTVEGRAISRGIFRDLPRYFQKDGRKLPYDYDVKSVTRDGDREPYEIERTGGAYRIRIGDADVLLEHRRHDYAIVYEVKNQVRYFGGYDEVYWNATGNYWAFPIDHARAVVTLPGAAPASQHAAYTGRNGEAADGYSYRFENGAHIFETTRGLRAGEGMTVSVGFAKGVVEPSSPGDARAEWWTINVSRIILGAAFLLIGSFYLILWRRIGRDPAKGPVFARYEPPEGYSPPAAHRVYYRGYSGHDAFIAALLDLAVKKRIVIEPDEKAKETTLRRIDKGAPGGVSEIEHALERGLFGGSNVMTFGGDYSATLTDARQSFQSALDRQYGAPYFRWNRGFLLMAVAVSAAAVIIAASFAIEWTPFHSWMVAALAVMAVAASYFLPAPTPLGQQVRTEIEGFRLYLETAEKLQLNAVKVDDDAPPPMSIQRYERFLPYAIALGVEKPWTEHFEKIMPEEAARYSPAWAHGAYAGGRSLSGVNRALVAGIASGVTSSLPQSSSSSGSGGGGFSGGGGGGGGGGGW